jgi:hypothetical protein
MTVRDLVQLADRNPLVLVGVFVLLPLAAWVCGLLHDKGRGGTAPWRYVYSVLVYMACVPGLLSAVLTAYTLFFTRENLLDTSLLTHFVPIVSMIVTLAIIRSGVSFDDVPGFDRLSGLMVMIGCCFGLALAIQKTRIWVVFGGSLQSLIVLSVAIFALLKWWSHMLFSRKGGQPGRP